MSNLLQWIMGATTNNHHLRGHWLSSCKKNPFPMFNRSQNPSQILVFLLIRSISKPHAPRSRNAPTKSWPEKKLGGDGRHIPDGEDQLQMNDMWPSDVSNDTTRGHNSFGFPTHGRARLLGRSNCWWWWTWWRTGASASREGAGEQQEEEGGGWHRCRSTRVVRRYSYIGGRNWGWRATKFKARGRTKMPSSSYAGWAQNLRCG